MMDSEDGSADHPFVLDDSVAAAVAAVAEGAPDPAVLMEIMSNIQQGLQGFAGATDSQNLMEILQRYYNLNPPLGGPLAATSEPMDTSGSSASLGATDSVPVTPTSAPAMPLDIPRSSSHGSSQNAGKGRKMTSDMRSLSGSSSNLTGGSSAKQGTIADSTKGSLRSMLLAKRPELKGTLSNSSGSGLGSGPPTPSGIGGGGGGGGARKTPPSQVHAPSPLYEPYPVQAIHHRELGLNVTPSDYALRKVNSEPNIAMKAKIRAKLLSRTSPVHSANSAFNFHTPGLTRQDSADSLSGGYGLNPPSIVFPQSMMASPSLPNLLPPLGGGMNADLASLLAASTGLNSFLSLPSLLKNQVSGLGMTDDMSVMDRDRIAALGSLGIAGLPSGGYQTLLKQQLRDLVLRRKSLVREEPEDEAAAEGGEGASSSILPPSFLSATGLGGLNTSTSGTSLGSNCSIGGDGKRTGLAYDSAMAKHECVCGVTVNHVEHGGRVQSIWARLTEKGLVARCEKIPSKKAPLDLMKLVHPNTYSTFYSVSPTACAKAIPDEIPIEQFVRMQCGGIGVDNDTYYNDATTPVAARLAVGNLVDLSYAVMEGKVRNGFACIRPPGNHAEHKNAMGFCFFNNIAIAARALQHKYKEAAKRIVIFDWDVHHGNGTQPIFIDDPSVLYMSIHRYDNGGFFPGTGSVTEVGQGEGKGFNINIACNVPDPDAKNADGELINPEKLTMGDAEYLAIWRTIVAPVLESFDPDFILVSSGFDASTGHERPLGGYEVSPAMFGYMTKSLMNFANGKVALALEGGYNLSAIADCAEECVRVLSSNGEEGGVLSQEALEAVPHQYAIDSIQKVIALHKGYWPALVATGSQPLNVSELQWQLVHQQFKNMSVGDSS